jgi:hypothetical protein
VFSDGEMFNFFREKDPRTGAEVITGVNQSASFGVVAAFHMTCRPERVG